MAGARAAVGQSVAGFNSTLVRLAWLLSVFLGALGILVYLTLWIVLPKGPRGHARDPNRRAALRTR